MADWPHLPVELLDLISKHLNSETDILRFRSVCSTWRSTVNPSFPRFPILPNAGISETSWGFYLSKRTIFRLTLPQSDSQSHPNIAPSWLIKLERDAPQRMHLLNHPLSRSEFYTLPESFPNPLDLSGMRVEELGNEYTLQCINYRPFASSIEDSDTHFMEKVAFSLRFCDGLFAFLAIHVSGKLALLKQGETKWTIIDDFPAPYDDVTVFDGDFYAVDSTGRAVVLIPGPSPGVKVVANGVFGGDKKYLVDSWGELYMVDKYLPEDDFGFDDNFEFYEDFDCFTSERTIEFEVFKLDRERETWVEVKNLGDRMLFLGDNCAFSASASEFSGVKGNCIFFTGQNNEEDGLPKGRVGVYDLEMGSIGPISHYPGCSELFWPPPSWVCSPISNGLEAELSQLRISFQQTALEDGGGVSLHSGTGTSE